MVDGRYLIAPKRYYRIHARCTQCRDECCYGSDQKQNGGCNTKRNRIDCTYAEQKAADQARERDAHRYANDEAEQNRCEVLDQHETEYGPNTRAKRNADSDLLRALRDSVSDYTVDPDRCYRESKQAEQSKDEHSESLRQYGVASPICKR